MLKVAAVASLTCFVGAFVPGPRHGLHAHPTHALMAEPADRRHFFEAVSGAASALALMTTPSSAGAIVYLDPARYGDQELKVAAVAGELPADEPAEPQVRGRRGALGECG